MAGSKGFLLSNSQCMSGVNMENYDEYFLDDSNVTLKEYKKNFPERTVEVKEIQTTRTFAIVDGVFFELKPF